MEAKILHGRVIPNAEVMIKDSIRKTTQTYGLQNSFLNYQNRIKLSGRRLRKLHTYPNSDEAASRIDCGFISLQRISCNDSRHHWQYPRILTTSYQRKDDERNDTLTENRSKSEIHFQLGDKQPCRNLVF